MFSLIGIKTVQKSIEPKKCLKCVTKNVFTNFQKIVKKVITISDKQFSKKSTRRTSNCSPILYISSELKNLPRNIRLPEIMPKYPYLLQNGGC